MCMSLCQSQMSIYCKCPHLLLQDCNMLQWAIWLSIPLLTVSVILIDRASYGAQNYSWSSHCLSDHKTRCSTFNNECGAHIFDNAFHESDITSLHRIATTGMSLRENSGGPTILDINTGFLRDTNGIQNIFMEDTDIFSAEDFGHYGSIIKRLKSLVETTFETEVYFTAPTFITRLDGQISWNPQGTIDPHQTCL